MSNSRTYILIFAKNWQTPQQISSLDYLSDTLVVAGDIADAIHLALNPRLERVFW